MRERKGIEVVQGADALSLELGGPGAGDEEERGASCPVRIGAVSIVWGLSLSCPGELVQEPLSLPHTHRHLSLPQTYTQNWGFV